MPHCCFLCNLRSGKVGIRMGGDLRARVLWPFQERGGIGLPRPPPRVQWWRREEMVWRRSSPMKANPLPALLMREDGVETRWMLELGVSIATTRKVTRLLTRWFIFHRLPCFRPLGASTRSKLSLLLTYRTVATLCVCGGRGRGEGGHNRARWRDCTRLRMDACG